jgi:hypothetical protein
MVDYDPETDRLEKGEPDPFDPDELLEVLEE